MNLPMLSIISHYKFENDNLSDKTIYSTFKLSYMSR